LKMFHLADENGMPNVQIGSSGIKTGLHPQRLAGFERLLQPLAQFGFADDFRCAFLDVRELLVNRREVRHSDFDYMGLTVRLSRILRPGDWNPSALLRPRLPQSAPDRELDWRSCRRRESPLVNRQDFPSVRGLRRGNPHQSLLRSPSTVALPSK